MAYIIYTKDNCPYCINAKHLLVTKSLPYTEIRVGRDITRDELLELYPQIKTVPVIIDTTNNAYKFVGGYNELREHLGID